MKVLQALSLRQRLTVPYVFLILLLCAVTGAASYATRRAAVEGLQQQWLAERVARSAETVQRHVGAAANVLDVALPATLPPAKGLVGELDSLPLRLFQAASLHPDGDGWAYYTDRHGHVLGVARSPAGEAEVLVGSPQDGQRSLLRSPAADGGARRIDHQAAPAEARVEPWLTLVSGSPGERWTAPHVAPRNDARVITLARRVDDSSGHFQGVVATDVALAGIDALLRSLALPAGAVALIVDAHGELIATSRAPSRSVQGGGTVARPDDAVRDDPLIAASQQELGRLEAAPAGAPLPRVLAFEAADGQEVTAAAVRLHDAAGLDWTVVVALPSSALPGDPGRSILQAVLLTVVAALLTLLLGLAVYSVVAADLQRLSGAARRFGSGEREADFDVARSDEIGDLARSFRAMHDRLLSDRLTGLANREAFLRRVDERLFQQRDLPEPRPFAVLFIDLNDFKHINDSFGHDVGDRVLREMAQRMLAGLRSRDLVARYAGDEFVVLLDTVRNRRDAEQARGKLEQLLGGPLQATDALGPAGASGASVGLSMYPEDGQDVDSLVRRADADMYRRKNRRSRPAGQPSREKRPAPCSPVSEPDRVTAATTARRAQTQSTPA
ncbi:diguanylate cyclase domain-containing protein [Accumulibacter sp.]|uniref:diguanylate cyclase domain-containing protein n=1 Tax=Accumulibacter sp. TaxID=2053492 RepID=UPI0025E5453E|nr:diguanylate cyclase [Accumulibacter sp.]MCM8594355.1 diguanylate cyclase [Accumulibacter sp.]MCM8625010.1 diguanylate cyclase [Accumulibacter sp.]MDS4048499.1 diguanylate cyclase [Accumulibacter sp.]